MHNILAWKAEKLTFAAIVVRAIGIADVAVLTMACVASLSWFAVAVLAAAEFLGYLPRTIGMQLGIWFR